MKPNSPPARVKFVAEFARRYGDKQGTVVLGPFRPGYCTVLWDGADRPVAELVEHLVDVPQGD